MAKLSPAFEAEVTKAMAERNLSRKSAVQYVRRQASKVAVDIETTDAAGTPTISVVQGGDTVLPVVGGALVNPLPVEVMGTEGYSADEIVAKPEVPAPVAPEHGDVIATAVAAPAETAAPVAKGKPGRKGLSDSFKSDEAVRLYGEGKKVVDIAVALGYERGKGQNRVRIALMAAGVYKQAKPEGESPAK